jgi:hypothetical protein
MTVCVAKAKRERLEGKKKDNQKKTFYLFFQGVSNPSLIPYSFLVFTTLERMEGERKETTN